MGYRISDFGFTVSICQRADFMRRRPRASENARFETELGMSQEKKNFGLGMCSRGVPTATYVNKFQMEAKSRLLSLQSPLKYGLYGLYGTIC